MGESKRKISAQLIFTAAVVALGVLSYWWMFYQVGYSSGAHQQRAHIEREHYAADAAKQLRECSRLASAAASECAYQAANSEREAEREESDLAAQWKAADWVLWAAIIGGAQLIATMIGLYYIKGTLDATREAVEDTSIATQAMERQNELTADAQRPWLSFKDVTAFIYSVTDQGDQIGITIFLQATAFNSGDRPALKALFRGEAAVDCAITALPREAAQFDSFHQNQAGPGINIAPKSEHAFRSPYVVHVSKEELGDIESIPVVNFMLSLGYIDGLSTERHQTAQSFLGAQRVVVGGGALACFRLREVVKLLDERPEDDESTGVNIEMIPFGYGRMT